jgi:hypothetical protein
MTLDGVGRRGLFAWAATLAGASLAWLSGAGRAEATHNASGTPGADSAALHVDQVNKGLQRTFLVADIGGNPPIVAFNGVNPFSIGSADAAQGITQGNGAGIRGRNQAASGRAVGVMGETASASGNGVVGTVGLVPMSSLPQNVGVLGRAVADFGMGVRGQIPSNSIGTNTIAVYGENFSSDPGPGPGAGGFGVYGFSALGHGLVGATGTAGGGAVIGSTNGVPGAVAGIFYGPLIVMGAKNAAIPHPDGAHRLLYCVESPESWFEDFGNAKLVRGCGSVTVDPEFARVADVSDYHVYLTPYGNSKGLHVVERSPEGFAVEENEGGRSDIEFGWRVVARRKDIEAPRFAKVTLPAEPVHPTRPKPESAVAPLENPAPKKKKFPEPPHSHK